MLASLLIRIHDPTSTKPWFAECCSTEPVPLRGGADASSTLPPAEPHQPSALQSQASKKISLYTNFKVVTIKGDGRCMFRALVRLSTYSWHPQPRLAQEAGMLRRAAHSQIVMSQARGLARNVGSHLGSSGSATETNEADELRTAVYEAMCRSDSRRSTFSEALPEIQMEGGLER